MQPPPNRSPEANFPANREKNREISRNGLSVGILTLNPRANSKLCNEIPYATEQGIFKRVAGNFASKKQGKMLAQTRQFKLDARSVLAHR
jgi:hypothetical protein